MGETIDKCDCGLFMSYGMCPRCDEIAYDLLEQELLDFKLLDENGGN